MPPKKNRLTKKDLTVISKKEIIRGPFFDVWVVKNSYKDYKIACVLSKKTAKKAVERNKIRRKIYTAFTSQKEIKPYIYIIYPKREVLTLPFLKVKDEINNIFDRIN